MTPFAPSGTLRAHGYRVLWSCAEGLLKAANACLYLAVGLLRPDDLRTASQLRWRHFGTPAVDDVEVGLDAWERRLYGDVLRAADRVLLVACGAGRDLVALRELGYDVTGLEPTPELVNLARELVARRGLNVAVCAGFIETWNLDDNYDVVIFSSGCYSFVPQAASRVATLARIKTHLAPEGRIVITYLEFRQQSSLSIALMRASAGVANSGWRPERGDCFSRDHLARRVLRYEHAFRPGDVARECADAGLRVVRDEGMGSGLRCTVAVV